MDEIVSLLTRRRWSRIGEMASDYDKPLFGWCDLKAVVGKVWVTVWQLPVEGEPITQMASVKTDDPTAVGRLLETAEAGYTFGK